MPPVPVTHRGGPAVLRRTIPATLAAALAVALAGCASSTAPTGEGGEPAAGGEVELIQEG
jgi:transposase